LCVGETLWDILPNGMFLGGAPTNVAIHLASLNTPVSIVSCINPNDDLGKSTLDILTARGVKTDIIQSPPSTASFETGKVIAKIDTLSGDASYTFDTPSAWDYLRLGSSMMDKSYQKLFLEMFEDANTIVMGSICARLDPMDPFTTNLSENNEITKDEIKTQNATSASSLFWVRNNAKKDSLVFDVNLRPPWYTPERVLKLALGENDLEKKEKYSTNPLALLKVNEEELEILENWCDEILLKEDGLKVNNEDKPLFGDGLRKRMERLATLLNTNRICVTRGDQGAALWCTSHLDSSSSVFSENDGYTNPDKHEDSDTVGAGDAFLGALIRSLFIEKETPEVALQRSCALGSFVAGCQGAVPDHSDAPSSLKGLFSFS